MHFQAFATQAIWCLQWKWMNCDKDILSYVGINISLYRISLKQSFDTIKLFRSGVNLIKLLGAYLGA